MPDLLAYAAHSPNSRYNTDPSPIASRTENFEFYRHEFKKTNERRLWAKIKIALAEVLDGFNQDEIRQADQAISDAIEVVRSIEFSEMPWVSISDDCIVSMHWERHDVGVLLTFAGDGQFAFAMKSGPSASYASGFTERSKMDGLPGEIRSEISRLSSQVGASQTAA